MNTDLMIWRVLGVLSLFVSLAYLMWLAYRSGRKTEAKSRGDAYTSDGDPTGLPDVPWIERE